MAKKQVYITIETNEKVDKISAICQSVFGLSENEVYKLFIKTGFQNGSKDFIDALYKGADVQQDFLNHAKQLLKLKKAANRKIEPVNIVEKNLMPLVDKLQDDELVEQIKSV